MGSYRLSIEAVSFDKTMLDTDDLATIRGASWAMLELADGFAAGLATALQDKAGLKIELLFAGASRADLRVSADGLSRHDLEKTAQALLAGEPDNDPIDDAWKVAPFLRFACAAVEEGEDAPIQVENARAVARMQMLDVDLPDVLSRKEREARIEADASASGARADARHALERINHPCTHDGVRPVERLGWRSTDDRPVRDVPLSASTYARKEFGRIGRRAAFYSSQARVDLAKCPGRNAEAPGLSLADSFEEIAYEAPPKPLPATVSNTMCVLSMDGNAFGKLKERFVAAGTAAGKDEDAARKEFADEMRKRRRALLAGIVNHFCDAELARWLQVEPAKKRLEGGAPRPWPALRFETLIWGADENMLVFPGWALTNVLSCLSRLLENDAAPLRIGDDEVRLSYGIGVAVGNYKTPIRAMKGLADQLCDNAKARGKAGEADPASYIDVMVLGGIDMPVRSLAAEREKLFADVEAADGEASFAPAPEAFCIPLAVYPEVMRRFEIARGTPGDKSDGIPRAKLVSLLDKVISKRAWNDDDLCEELTELLQAHDGRIEGANPSKFPADWLTDATVFEWCAEARLAPLLHLVTLWNHLGIMPLPAVAAGKGEADT